MNTTILEAVLELGYVGSFVGETPASVADITDSFLTETVHDSGESRPRLVLESGTVTAEQVRDKLTELLAAENVTEIKQKANEVILTHFPEWKQRNYIARGLELTNKVATGGTLTTEEEAELAGLQTHWDWVKQVRTVSDEAEAANTMVSTISWPTAP